MNWLPALLTLAGTIVGASITLVAERLRWRRDQRQRGIDARRDAYAAYLTALHVTGENIRAVSVGEHNSGIGRPAASRTAFRDASLNAAREQIVLLARAPVVRAAGNTFTSLRALRDIVGQGDDPRSPSYQQILAQYLHALKKLRNLMREDLGTPSLEGDIIF